MMISTKLMVKIDDCLNQLILSRVIYFYPDLVAKYTGGNIIDVYDYLKSLTYYNKLQLKWEVICTTPRCSYKLGKYDNVQDILGKYVNCPICGEDILVTEDNLIPVFSFDETYRKEQKELLVNQRKKKLA